MVSLERKERNMKTGRDRLVIAGVVCASAAALSLTMFACTPQGDSSASAAGSKISAAEGLTVDEKDGIRHVVNNEVAAKYPEIWASIDHTEQGRSHAFIEEYMSWENGGTGDHSALCIACKSDLFNEAYAELGDDMFKKDADGKVPAMSDLSPELQEKAQDMWTCTTCHEGSPEGAVSSQIEYFNMLGADLIAEISDNVAACGQCHNALSPVRAIDGLELTNTNPYKYGITPDGFRQFSLEEGGVILEDEATGIVVVRGNHPTVEMFHGSQHEAMGLDCSDCHMITMTSEDGKSYTSHNASGLISQNNLALEKCLDCHKTQNGLETPKDMLYFLRAKQTELANKQGAVQTKLNALYDQILAAVQSGDVDEATLDAAREAYGRATGYIEWGPQSFITTFSNKNISTNPLGGSDGRGATAAHNFDGSMDYLARAEAMIDDASAALNSK